MFCRVRTFEPHYEQQLFGFLPLTILTVYLFLSWLALGLIVGIVSASFFEWILHRYLMHRKVRIFDYPFQKHALVHHRVFKADESYHLLREEDKRTVPMAWWNGPVLIAVSQIPFVALAFFVGGLPLVCGTCLSIALYYGAYEYLHWCMHIPRNRKVERNGIFFRLNGHHLLHHRYTNRNFNVVLPLADLLFGTLLPRSKVCFGQARGAAVPDVQPLASDSLNGSSPPSRTLALHLFQAFPGPYLRNKAMVALAAFFVLLPNQCGLAAQKSQVSIELNNLVKKIQAKVKEGKKTKAELAPELNEFGPLLAKHQGQKTDDVANILYTEAMLYVQVLDDPAKGRELIRQLKRDFPLTEPGRNAQELLASIDKQEDKKSIQRALVPGSKFPDFSETDVARKPLSLANYKGKVVLIDFWASWCAPCVAELPNLLKVYEKYHARGFEIIGVNLDQDEMVLTAFTTRKQIPWQQFSDGMAWRNKLVLKYGVTTIPATYLLDREGTIIAKDLRGKALETAVAKTLARK
jgi:thiol-disulfide isomerase/thioredoxin